jgi:lipopolysaccharide transport system ATP-binding protein
VAVLEFSGVWKRYRGVAHSSVKKIVSGHRSGLMYGREYALRDISLSLSEGEALGVVGHNGAGKSSLLKLALGVLKPDKGRIKQPNSVGSMISLDAGFHPDLSGLDNIFIASSILGKNRKDTASKVEQIIEFAELGDCIDDPLRTYSSGMSARLGFSLLVNYDWDLLVIDEVLAVGDQNFQKKCIGFLNGYKNEGGTLVVVSHNPIFLESFCSTGIWLDAGNVACSGSIGAVLQAYRKQIIRERPL